MSEKQPYNPITPDEFRRDIHTALIIMRQRSEGGGGLTKIIPEILARTLAERLLQSNIIPMRGPGLRNATADEYPGNAKQRPE